LLLRELLKSFVFMSARFEIYAFFLAGEVEEGGPRGNVWESFAKSCILDAEQIIFATLCLLLRQFH